MDGLITQVGVGGIFALLVIKEVFAFVKNKNGKSNEEKDRAEFFKKHFEESHDTCESQKRTESTMNTLKEEAIKQTTLLKTIARNGGKK